MADGSQTRESLTKRVDALTSEERARLARALEERKRQAPGIPRRSDAGPAALSFSQESLWFLEQWNPGAPTNHGVRAFRLDGDLSMPALQSALRSIVDRHEILHTVYVSESSGPVQVPLEAWDVPLPVVELAADDGEAALERVLREESRRPFDLTTDVLLRPTLFRLGPSEHVLLLAMHHIAADGWSGSVLNRELGAAYSAHVAGRAPDLPELPLQYADYAVWQRNRLQGRELERLVAWWAAELEGAPERLRLPTDRARPAVQMHRGRHLPVAYEGALGAALSGIAREEGATSYMAFLAAFAILLYRFSGQNDVLVGTPVANRNHVELENLIGFFSNTLVVRNRIGGNPSFREVVRRVRRAVVGALEHQELPFEKLVESLRVSRDPGQNPLFQVNFRAAAPAELPDLAGLVVSPVTVDIGFSRFDMALELQLDGDRVGGYFEYDEELFEHETIEALARDLDVLLAAVADDPDRPVIALPPPERAARRHPRRIARTAN